MVTAKSGVAQNTQAMLEAAGMNWQVVVRDLAYKVGKGDKAKWLATPMKNFKAICRSDNGFAFMTATKKYNPVQNEAIVDMFREYCDAGDATLETVGTLRGGAVVWALARLKSDADAVLQGVDELQGYILLATSHDGSLRTIGKATQIRVASQSCLSAAVVEAHADKEIEAAPVFMMKHTRKFDEKAKAQAKKMMEKAIDELKTTNAIAAKLAKAGIDEKQMLEFVLKVLRLDDESQRKAAKQLTLVEGVAPEDMKLKRLGKAMLEAIQTAPGADLPTAKNTFWGAVCGTCFFHDHVRGNGDPRLFHGWFGGSDTIKSRALKIAVEMSGVKL